MGDYLPTQLLCAAGAGFVASVVGSPVCVLKTRLMSMDAGQSSLQMVRDILSHEGPGAFYKGYTAMLMRTSCWNCILFVALEQIKTLFG